LNEHYSKKILAHGLKQLHINPSLYVKTQMDNLKHFMAVYVDNVLIASPTMGRIVETKKILSDNFEMMDLGEATEIILWQIEYTLQHISLNQRKYIDEKIKIYKFEEAHTADNPIAAGVPMHWQRPTFMWQYLRKGKGGYRVPTVLVDLGET
jgi:Reverse transcriptase (RNA-dependent DNA polymerase)